MVLTGNIIGLVGRYAVVNVGGNLIPVPVARGLTVGTAVRVSILPGKSYRTSSSVSGSQRLLLLDGRTPIVLSIPRTSVIPTRVDLVVTPTSAAVPRAATRSNAVVVADDTIEAAGPDRDTLFVLPPAIRALLPQQSGPIPQ